MSSALLLFSHFFGENVCNCGQCVFLSLVYSIARFYADFNVSFKNIRASSALLHQNYTSVYSFGYEFRFYRNIASDRTSGIRAASENSHHIISATDGGVSKQNRVRTANSQLKNEHGRSFFSVPAGVFFLRLEPAPPIFKKADFYRAFISSTESPVIFEIKSMPRFSYFISFAVSSFVWYEPSAMPSAKAISRSSARCTAISVS